MDDQLKVVGSCPQCGFPIYSSGESQEGKPPRNIPSCDCHRKTKTTEVDAPIIKYG